MYLFIDFRKSIPSHNRQPNILIGVSEQQVDDCLGELTFNNQSIELFFKISSYRVRAKKEELEDV